MAEIIIFSPKCRDCPAVSQVEVLGVPYCWTHAQAVINETEWVERESAIDHNKGEG